MIYGGKAVSASAVRKSTRKVRLAATGRSSDEDMLPIADPITRCQGCDGGSVESATCFDL